MVLKQAFAGILVLLNGLTAIAQEDESLSGVRPSFIDIGVMEVPDGDVTDVIEFMEEVTQLQRELSADYRNAVTKIGAAQTAAAIRLLEEADELTDEQFAIAARYGLSGQVRTVAQNDADEQRHVFELVRRQLSIAADQGMNRGDLVNASMFAKYLERDGDPQIAKEAYETFAELIKSSGVSSLNRHADSFEASARRLALLGKELELEGQLLDGSDFDWSAYRGKVVLVDFWATWCGPCRAEAPNVRKYYEIYHDHGFEVVGISLDTQKKSLEAYLKKEQVPWANLFENGAGWKHPMATKYGIQAIPSVYLISKDGKVVSLNARGAELGKQLEKLLGPVSEEELRAVEQRMQREKQDRAAAALGLPDDEVEKLGGRLLAQGCKSSWSPDGTQIVFRSVATANDDRSGWGNTAIDVATGKTSRISESGNDPAWSPGKGRFIAYVDRGESASEAIWIAESSGKNRRSLVAGGFPSWSPDGSEIYYHSREKRKLMAIQVETVNAEPKEIMACDYWYPAFRADGKHIAYRSGKQLIIADCESGKVLKQYEIPGGRGFLGSWSPDGKYIAYGGYGYHDKPGLWMVKVDTGESRQLLQGFYTMPAWSPDGSKMSIDQRLRGNFQVWVMDAPKFDSLKPGR
jgi:thiol-disulfide isomerase/thioredoxin